MPVVGYNTELCHQYTEDIQQFPKSFSAWMSDPDHHPRSYCIWRGRSEHVQDFFDIRFDK